eukprot:TRINITY_DN14235_c0_g1_i1.p1 TRINITY_DN14235_c0_g1~~TRINITY_DN14235_c0_g1_i1.p1  ORF type:complete len:971 (-),score=140.51 TRINITY_DN14235_c0_g1_i1:215-3127(-)
MEDAVTFEPGQPTPMGCLESEDGAVNFTLAAPGKNSAWLVLRPHGSEKEMLQPLDAKMHRTDHTWHIRAKLGSRATGARYAWLLDPPLDEEGKPLPSAKRIIDPYARSLDSPNATKWNVRGEQRYGPMALVPDKRFLQAFDWQGVKSPGYHLKDLIFYEAHVRGFTKNPDSSLQTSENAGTFLGFLEKIPYLVELGVNCVEFLPVFEFDETNVPRKHPNTGDWLCNYWGYMTVSFFVPMQRFDGRDRDSASITGFKTLVRELHRAGIEVCLDVVYNHTGEGNWGSTWSSLDAIARPQYYLLSKGHHTNYTGCGNTVNANDPLCMDFIIESLRYWVVEMHVDAFRFDLASCLTRGPNGQVMGEPPLMRRIAEDPDLRHVKMIAEPWDCSWPDGYLVGRFPGCGKQWGEWNGIFRDKVRCFLKGDQGAKGDFASRMCGSADLYKNSGRKPHHSVNFITAHDGFTLRDLVSYNFKHNGINNEESGDDHNNSWNCGCEGPTGDHGVNSLRERQMRNFLVALFLSAGTPMLVFGDEYGRSQNGCNNGWCQDALSWFSWSDCAREKDRLVRFTRLIIQLRKTYAHIFCREDFMSEKDIWWRVDWEDPYNYLCYVLHDHKASNGYSGLLIAFNAGHEHRNCDLPLGKKWYRIIDTNLASPDDFCDNETNATRIDGGNYGMPPYSCIVLKCMQDKTGALSYKESDDKYAQQQAISEQVKQVAAFVTRRVSGCLLDLTVDPGAVHAASMMLRKASMAGIVLDLDEEDDEDDGNGSDEKQGPDHALIKRLSSLTVLPPPGPEPTEEEIVTRKQNRLVRKLSRSIVPPVEDDDPSSEQDGEYIQAPSKMNFEPAPRTGGDVSGGATEEALCSVKFSVECQATKPGEAVFVVGSSPCLGNWAPAKALRLKTGPTSFPNWASGEVSLPPGSIEFKLLIGPEAGTGAGARWEGGANRQCEPQAGKGQATLTCKWGASGATVSFD